MTQNSMTSEQAFEAWWESLPTTPDDDDYAAARLVPHRNDTIIVVRPEVETAFTAGFLAATARSVSVKADLTKLMDVVETYITSPGLIRGEAFRDLSGTFDWLKGARSIDELQGWPMCYEREKQRADSATDETRRLREALEKIKVGNVEMDGPAEFYGRWSQIAAAALSPPAGGGV